MRRVRNAGNGACHSDIALVYTRPDIHHGIMQIPMTAWTMVLAASLLFVSSTAWAETYHVATHPNDQRHRLVGRCELLIVDGQVLKQVELREQLTARTLCLMR